MPRTHRMEQEEIRKHWWYIVLGFSSCGRPKLRAQNLRPLRPLYKRARKRILFFFFFFQFFAATGGRRKEREMGEPPFLKLEKKIQFFLHYPDFIKGPTQLRLWVDRPKIWRKGSWLIDLHSERWDRIWRSGRSSFSLRKEPPFWCVFYPDSFDHELPSRLIRGSIETIFGENVQNSLVFILNGGD